MEIIAASQAVEDSVEDWGQLFFVRSYCLSLEKQHECEGIEASAFAGGEDRTDQCSSRGEEHVASAAASGNGGCQDEPFGAYVETKPTARGRHRYIFNDIAALRVRHTKLRKATTLRGEGAAPPKRGRPKGSTNGTHVKKLDRLKKTTGTKAKQGGKKRKYTKRRRRSVQFDGFVNDDDLTMIDAQPDKEGGPRRSNSTNLKSRHNAVHYATTQETAHSNEFKHDLFQRPLILQPTATGVTSSSSQGSIPPDYSTRDTSARQVPEGDRTIDASSVSENRGTKRRRTKTNTKQYDFYFYNPAKYNSIMRGAREPPPTTKRRRTKINTKHPGSVRKVPFSGGDDVPEKAGISGRLIPQDEDEISALASLRHFRKSTEIQLAWAHRAGEKNEQSADTDAGKRVAGPCNCRKSKCLKLYCECFAALSFCNDLCNCRDCGNTHENDASVREAVAQARAKNRNAFEGKISSIGGGCNCKRSRCLQKYCICFQASVFCGVKCRCLDCSNTPTDRLSALPCRIPNSADITSYYDSTTSIKSPPPLSVATASPSPPSSSASASPTISSSQSQWAAWAALTEVGIQLSETSPHSPKTVNAVTPIPTSTAAAAAAAAQHPRPTKSEFQDKISEDDMRQLE